MAEAEYDLVNYSGSDKELERYFGVKCARCGEDGLHWGYHKGKSRLFHENGDLHVCPQPSNTIPRKGYKCQRCGHGGLIWKQLENGSWRLHHKDGNLHTCLTGASDESHSGK